MRIGGPGYREPATASTTRVPAWSAQTGSELRQHMSEVDRFGWSPLRLAAVCVVAVVVLNLLFVALGMWLWSSLIGSVVTFAMVFVVGWRRLRR